MWNEKEISSLLDENRREMGGVRLSKLAMKHDMTKSWGCCAPADRSLLLQRQQVAASKCGLILSSSCLRH